MPSSTEASPVGSRGVDYSKFDNIVDSDDEKPTPAKPSSDKVTPAEKPHCANCHKEISKPLRCSVCKKAAYCTAQCQKDDWQFHKRLCKKADPPKPKKTAESPSESKPAPRPEAKRKEEETAVEADEKLTWYRHREWKPTSEPKQEFKPTKIEASATPAAGETLPTKAGSAWNAAGTWEEKDVTEKAIATLTSKLSSGMPEIEAVGGILSLKEVTDVSGDASKPVVRGKLRHLFDFSFKVVFTFKWPESDGHKTAEGSIEVSDFCNDTSFGEGASSPPVVKLTFKDSSLAMDRRRALEASIGAKQWPAPTGSLMAAISERMDAWSQDYQQEN